MSHLLGEIRRFAGGQIPDGWLACDGRSLPIAEHQPLFSLVGWRFGGDGWTTFRLPTLPATILPLEHGIASSGIYPTRDDPMLEDAYVGEIRLFGGAFPPAGWLPCDGRKLPIAEPFLELYDVIGEQWGGDDGRFAVPDLRGEEQQLASGTVGNLTYIIATAGKRPEAS
jgi:microcystin-dependent protein